MFKISAWRPGLWCLSLSEFLPFRCGCLSVVWWNVAEYLGCQTINRWGEHAKRASVNSAHVINPSDPSIPHLMHTVTCADVLSWLSTLFSLEAHVDTTTLRHQQYERKIPRTVICCPEPTPSSPLCLWGWQEETGVKDQLSEKHHHAGV